MRSICLFIVICGIFFSCKNELKKELKLIPYPKEVVYKSGYMELDNQLIITYSGGLEFEAGMLSSFLKNDYGIQVKLEEKGKNGDIILSLDSTVLLDQKEGYILKVLENKITISSSYSSGIMHGIQSLRQIINKQGDILQIQKLVITDYPTFSWRAFMLDEGRYFKGKEVVLNLLDRMSELKMNVFHWHLTDDQGWRIEIKKYPELTRIGAFRDSTEINHFGSNVFDGKPHGGFYTQEDIKEIVDYATKRHITIVPEIEMPGHASAAIAAYPWLGADNKKIKVPCKFGVQYNVYNIANPKVLTFLEDVIDEVITLFPSPVFHIGGDEVRYDQWKSSSEVLAYMKQHDIQSPAGLQVYFTNNISNLLASKNKRMMGWNEITGEQINDYQQDGSSKSQHQLTKETIVHFWKGDTILIKKAIKDGYDIVNSYHEYTYLDYSYESIPLKKAYEFNTIPKGLTEEEQTKVLGLGCQMWGEFIPTKESMENKIFPRIAAYAETGWSGEENKDYNRFTNSLDNILNKWKKEGINYSHIY
ncbi:MAG: beta-N-acetylhexosaminidase [Parabacteroides sp.]|nr:beta-N-acetylhexosaminidase [Parabacteroides sp.]